MSERLVEERYLCRTRGRWLDIATGETIDSVAIDPVSLPAARLDHPDVRHIVDRILRAADVRDGVGISTMHLPIGRLSTRLVIDAAAPALRSAGFVAVRAIVPLPDAIRRALLHRHVVVFAREGEWGSGTGLELTSWIRDLAAASPRSHLVVLLQSRRESPQLAGASLAREAPSLAFRPSKSIVPILGNFAVHRMRAACVAKRRRLAFPARSVRASVERSRAHAGAHAAEHRLRQLAETGDWEAARATAIRALGTAHAACDRRAIAVLAAKALVVSGDLAQAAAMLQGVCAETTTQRGVVDASISAARAQVLFWQGRFEAAAGLLSAVSSRGPDVRLWRVLSRWGAQGGEPPLLDSDAAECTAGSLLRMCLHVERALAVGDVDAARRALGRGVGRRLGPLEHALVTWLAYRCAGAADRPPPALTRFIHTTGARGILRWGLGRTPMNLLHGLPALLQLVQDADDEFCALRRACGWIREHVRADAAIVSSEGLAWIAGDGISAGDLHDPELAQVLAAARPRTVAAGSSLVVSAPMRYAATTIGITLVRGARDAGELLVAAAAALASACAPALRARLDYLALTAASQARVSEILGRSPVIAALRDATMRAAATGFPVLIEGESGTGKELVARAVHRLSARRDRRFAALNCAALTDDLVEAELFGYTRGAFTGANNHRAGLFEESHGSTLFLDEVAELSPRAQAKLLRVLQEREVRRIGDHLPRPVDVRVVAATNLPLAQAVGTGRFREDLLFRLAVVRIRVPPLRDRTEDIPLLAQAFWRSLIAETDKRALLGPDAIAAMCRHRWPGNVRELQNVVAGLVVAAPTRGRVGARHVAQVLTAGAAPEDSPMVTLGAARQALERRMLMAALSRHDGRCGIAARELGLSRQGLAKAMKRLGLEGRRAQPVTETPPGAASA